MGSRIFFISGHGYENIVSYESRQLLPKDTYLVALSECAVPTQAWQLFNLSRVFMDKTNEALLKDPVKNKKDIETLMNVPVNGKPAPGKSKLRIYGPGENYPELYTDFYAYFGKRGSAAKSGLYEFPIDPSTFVLQPTLAEDRTDRIAGDPKLHDQLYKGSIFPPKDKQGNTELRVSIREIIEKFGPGIYYYPICRSAIDSSDNYDQQAFKEWLEQYDGVDVETLNNINTPQEMYDYFTSLPQSTQVSFEKSYTGKQYIAALRNELKIPDIRAKSTLRHTTRGGKRKRRRTLRRKNFQRKRA